jgi:homoserine O-acetyltransferase
MGAFQALEWAVHEPVPVRAAVLLVPAVRAGGVIRTVTRQMVELIALDPRWRGGAYESPPVEGLRAAGRHYYPWSVTDEYLEATDPEQLAGEIDAAGERFTQFDAWNLIRRYQASSAHDVAAPFGGDLSEALKRVRARVLVLPCRQDRLLGLRTAQQIAEGVRHAKYAEIDSPRGHLAWRPLRGSPETAFITSHVRTFLLH